MAAAAEALSESQKEIEEDGLQDGSSGEVQSSLEKLTEILTQLTAEKARKSKASKVDLALDSISGGQRLLAVHFDKHFKTIQRTSALSSKD